MKAGRRKLSHIAYWLSAILLALLFLLPVRANATTIDFYTDGTIQSGDNYTTVNVWDTAKVVMTGGEAFYCNLYDSSTFNFYDGDIGVFTTYESSRVIADVKTSTGFELHNDSAAYLYSLGASSSVFIYDNAQLHIYGYNLKYDEAPSPNWITGQWGSGQSFKIYLRNIYDYNPNQVFLHEIPEPSTLCMLGLLAMLIRKRGN